MEDTPQTVFLADEAATTALAGRIARALRPGDLVLLEGDLGAGKTSLARGIVRTLCGDPEMEVPSPSFALVQPYQNAGASILHADLYRLRAEEEIEELGLLDDPGAIVLVEWPERVPELRERATMTIGLAIPPGGAGRVASIQAADGRPI
jgi:tRNA threonylcarbamoyladenosine biosynthesis protein TsaE